MSYRKRTISKLAILLLMASAVSGSFCLKLLAMPVLAAQSSSQTAAPMVMDSQITVSNNDICQADNQLDTKANKLTSDNDSNAPVISPWTSSGVKDCCLNKDHSSTAVLAGSNLSVAFIASPLFTAGENISLSYSDADRYFVILPPPQLAALASIKKNE